jgi:hypothetical protein
MRRTRQVIAVMVVATALCAADRSAVARPEPAPAPRAPANGFARTLARKLTRSFRQSVVTVRVQPRRADERAGSFPLSIRQAASGVRSRFSPFEFRLPPPAR